MPKCPYVLRSQYVPRRCRSGARGPLRCSRPGGRCCPARPFDTGKPEGPLPPRQRSPQPHAAPKEPPSRPPKSSSCAAKFKSCEVDAATSFGNAFSILFSLITLAALANMDCHRHRSCSGCNRCPAAASSTSSLYPGSSSSNLSFHLRTNTLNIIYELRVRLRHSGTSLHLCNYVQTTSNSNETTSAASAPLIWIQVSL